MTAEEFINDCTKRCSNESDWSCRTNHSEIHYFQPWLTPDEARKAVEIAREEVRQEILKKAESLLVGIDANGLSCVHIEGVLPDEIVKVYVFKEE